MNSVPVSLETSFAQLFGSQIGNFPIIHRVEIPIIQRDYAQGRPGKGVKRIRENFLDALCAAVTQTGGKICLDFVYGEMVGDTFYPIDGQQRLTTLFLLHWYIAWRADIPIKDQRWTKFSYATRPGARRFCECLAEIQPSKQEIVDGKKLSSCLKNQEWYLHPWEHDPTIQSMLTMLDTLQLHESFSKFSDEDFAVAWHRLVDKQAPAISFHLLPMPTNELTDDIYIKMNSRGKPLTDFENFKANFEALLKVVHSKRADEFANKIDTSWADILWAYKGEDKLIDDEFMRYFRFVTEVRAWQSGVAFDSGDLTEKLSELVYGPTNSDAVNHLDFLFRAFDTWFQKDIKAEFESLLTATPVTASAPLVLFNTFKNLPSGESPVDLFAACCRLYGQAEWTLSHTLLLYAVLLNRIENTANFPKQLRILRNLIEASIGTEITRKQMPDLLSDVRKIVVDGKLNGILAFNQVQVANENAKAALLAKLPSLHVSLCRLEDHNLLRGCLAAFDLSPSVNPADFIRRVDAFYKLFDDPSCWLDLTGALLSIGDYSRNWQRPTGHRFACFGASKNNEPWRDLFSGRKGENPHPATIVLADLLDKVVAVNNHLACLQALQQSFKQKCEASKELDWRYYLVRYPVMRSGGSGLYTISPSGYGICMLEHTVMRSYYRDPYLYSICVESGAGSAVIDPWFYGYEDEPREMVLVNSGIEIQCVDHGWQLSELPSDPDQKAAIDQIFTKYGIPQNGLLTVPQNNGVDIVDRVKLGADLLKDLVSFGL